MDQQWSIMCIHSPCTPGAEPTHWSRPAALKLCPCNKFCIQNRVFHGSSRGVGRTPWTSNTRIGLGVVRSAAGGEIHRMRLQLTPWVLPLARDGHGLVAPRGLPLPNPRSWKEGDGPRSLIWCLKGSLLVSSDAAGLTPPAGMGREVEIRLDVTWKQPKMTSWDKLRLGIWWNKNTYHQKSHGNQPFPGKSGLKKQFGSQVSSRNGTLQSLWSWLAPSLGGQADSWSRKNTSVCKRMTCTSTSDDVDLILYVVSLQVENWTPQNDEGRIKSYHIISYHLWCIWHMGVSIHGGSPIAGWYIRENQGKIPFRTWVIWGYLHFRKPPYCNSFHSRTCYYNPFLLILIYLTYQHTSSYI